MKISTPYCPRCGLKMSITAHHFKARKNYKCRRCKYELKNFLFITRSDIKRLENARKFLKK